MHPLRRLLSLPKHQRRLLGLSLLGFMALC
jgi:hypothetical protein